MASGSVSVRLPEEVLERLEKLAAERKEKVSDVVRALIIAGLDRKAGSGEDEAHKKAVTDYLEGIADILTALLHETVGARYFAEMGLSYSTDVESLLRERQPLAKEAKDRLMEQFDQAAQASAQHAWQEVLAMKERKGNKLG